MQRLAEIITLGCLFLVACETRTAADANRSNVDRDRGAARPAVSDTGDAKQRPASEAGPSAPRCTFRNIDFVVEPDLVLEVRRLVGELRATGPEPATFDDPRTFSIAIAEAEVALDMRSLAAMMNDYVFAGPDAPMRGLEIETEGKRLRIKGTLHKGVPVPFTMVGDVKATEQGEVEIVPVELHAAGVPVRGLLDFFGVELDDLVKAKDAVGIRVEENALYLQPRAILPPPRLDGRIVAVEVVGRSAGPALRRARLRRAGGAESRQGRQHHGVPRRRSPLRPPHHGAHRPDAGRRRSQRPLPVLTGGLRQAPDHGLLAHARRRQPGDCNARPRPDRSFTAPVMRGFRMARSKWLATFTTSVLAFLASATLAGAQEMPPKYAAVLEALGKKGDFKDGVLKVNIPRTDLKVTIGKRPAPTPFGFGGWLALTAGSGGAEVMMGDLVLLEDEVNPVMSAVLDNGLDVTALHNHFFHETPRVFFMHVHGMGTAADLARRVKPAVDLIDKAVARAPAPPPPAAATSRHHRRRGAGQDRRAPGRTERAGLQDHHRPRRPRRARARRGDQRADGPQHLGGVRRNRRRRDGRRRRRDARRRGDAGAEGAARQRPRGGRASTTT